ncbi:MAG: hydantoinase B/oxoprolinase family protein [Planctomycetota bacterium]|nr:hydantoinase B/oxoprolinase family protein [Planctomycetota bacterium]
MPPRESTRRSAPPPPWQLAIDTGGTFTDCIARAPHAPHAPHGSTHRCKVLSTGAVRATVRQILSPTELILEAEWLDRPAFAIGATLRPTHHQPPHQPPHQPAHPIAAHITRAQPTSPTNPGLGRVELRGTGFQPVYPPTPTSTLSPGDTVEISTGEEAPILAARLVTGTPVGHPLPTMHLRLATTRGTNALLQRRGGRVAFFVTEGFADLLTIGDQTRPDLFTLRVQRPDPLHEQVVEVHERLDAAGTVLRPLDLEALRADARRTLDAGIRTAAVALLHAWRNPHHERLIRDALLDEGFDHVSVSSDLGASIGFLARAQTTVVNAFLAPVIDRYLDNVAAPLDARSTLLVMTSSGGLIDRPGFAPKDSLLSGPAGGVVGAAAAGRQAGCPHVVSFDMGGTSTDCARCEGTPELIYKTRVGDARVGDAQIVSPSVAVETVAAGGGSVCRVEHAELRVGPESAGAEPGPACYGRGGPLTITDCNLLLGRIDTARFALPLDQTAAQQQANAVLADAREQLDDTLDLESLLAGFVDLANQRMAEAIRRITVRRGHDPADHALVAFGGAGPQHACAIAELLGMDRVIVPPDAGLLSAVGLTIAALERTCAAQVLLPLDETLGTLDTQLDDLEAHARAALPANVRQENRPVTSRRSAELRFAGQDDILELDADETHDLAARFAARSRAVFGYLPSNTAIELVTLRVTVAVKETHDNSAPSLRPPVAPASSRCEPPPPPRPPLRPHRVYTASWTDAHAATRESLTADIPLAGPALLTDPHSTVFVERGWRATADETGTITLRRETETPAASAQPTTASRAVEVELAVGKLAAIAEEMGERLCRAAVSTNVKQRRDFSCAILDAQGRLVVNAPHVPVHLGSMGVCVRAVRELLGTDLQHATIVTNHPAFGGSHLPDVTLIHPVHNAAGRLLGYTAARAHHAEIGGIAPGSMAPEATTLADEGVVIPPTTLGRENQVDWNTARQLFATGPHPSRGPTTNMRDLAASAHAVWAGARELRQLGDQLGAEGLASLGVTIRERAAARIRAALARMPDGIYHHQEPVRNGGPIRVRFEIKGERAIIDFAGSGQTHPNCLNATPAIVTSAAVYVLRLLIDEDLPLNEGLLEPVELRIPRGMLDPEFHHDPAACPAVAGGNVEMSQLLVESMLTALGLCAQSQGTMNNIVFGNESFGVYETLGGGCGAGPGYPGASAAHSHMTNTSLTDLEILEHRHPVRIERCTVRRGSGGRGRWPGGDGLVREYHFLTAVQIGVLSGRDRAASGLEGGSAGALAKFVLTQPDGTEEPLGAGTVTGEAGAKLLIETPGGGGYSSSDLPSRCI